MPSADPESDPARATGEYPSAALDHVVAAMHELQHPTRIGPYFIQQLIGEGGMGTVYRAEQRDPIHRIVAVKIIKLGMDTRQVIARFESERQALAVMNHPNVAKVLDAGSTESGRPYFVMEYVQGEPITTFADRHQLTVRLRLELFIQACDAVQHAHQKAIIHRDLKPSNVLVMFQDAKPTVKVIDFGVAKALSQKLTERTLFTETGQLVGTPEYMAPEQAESNALDVDTRSDVYSLGVILYELLSGSLPFDPKTLRSAGFNEIQRIIREVDPPRPSTKLSGLLGNTAQEVAKCRQLSLEALEKQLKSELEWIPLKAMRKDRAQRYASATEMSDDVRNYLEQRPLRAGPESAAYRARKFLRRNKRGAAAVLTMFLLLLAGVAATSWQAIRATRAENRALSEKRAAEVASENLKEVNRFLTDDLLASASPEITRGREMTVREAVDRAAETIAQRFGDRPMTAAAIHAVLADTYDALGLTARGLPHARAAYDLILRQRGADDEQTIIAMHEVGRELAQLDQFAESEPMLRETYARSRRLLGDDNAVTLSCLNSLAMCIRRQERFVEAEPLLRLALDGDRRVHGPQSEQASKSLNNLAVLLNTVGRTAEAEPLYRESLEIKRKLLGDDHPSYLQSLSNMARVLQAQGKLAEAEAMMRQTLSAERRVLGDDHPSTMLMMNNLAGVLAAEGKYDEAEALDREALDRRKRALPEDAPDTLQSMYNLGNVLALRGKYTEAEQLIREAVEKRRKVLGETHPYTLGATASLAHVYIDLGRFADAEPLLAGVCAPDMLARQPAEQQASVLARYGLCLAKLREFGPAEPVLTDALQRLRSAQMEKSDAMRTVLAALADVCDQTNRPEEAAKWRVALAAVATQPTTQK